MPPTTCPRTTQKSAAGNEYKKISPGVVEVFQEKVFWLWISQGGCCTEGGGTSKANWPPLNPSPSPNPSHAAPFSKKRQKKSGEKLPGKTCECQRGTCKAVPQTEYIQAPTQGPNKANRPTAHNEGLAKQKQGISKPTDKTKTNLNLHTLPQTTSHTFFLSYGVCCPSHF